MKTIFASFMLLSAAISGSGQQFSQAIGMSYSQFSGTYGNSDFASIMYTPKLIYTTGNSHLALVAPISYSLMVSSARSNASSVIEVPLAFEWGHKSGAVKDFFIGAGVSDIYNANGEQNPYGILGNIYLGAGFQAFGLPLELRLLGSRNLSLSERRMTRIGLGFSYVLR